MSAYSETSFDTKRYDDSRPNYPEPFYHELIKYHKEKGGTTQLAVDIGCGSGFVTFKLLEYFDHVIGTDPSSNMILQCQSHIPQSSENKFIEFSIGSAESHPSTTMPNSVDLITGAECCHWVDHAKFFTESARVLKPNGTLAYWFYKDPVFVGYPKANAIYENYTYNSSTATNPNEAFERYMGPYYQQPGHDYLRSLLKEKSPPPDLFYDIVRHEYISERDGAPTGTENAYVTKTPLFICKIIDMRWFLNYVKSWSAYHIWMKEHGDKYDIAEVFVDELKQQMGWDDDTKIKVIWDTVYTFARKK